LAVQHDAAIDDPMPMTARVVRCAHCDRAGLGTVLALPARLGVQLWYCDPDGWFQHFADGRQVCSEACARAMGPQ
jgi:hypothetical protein